MGHNSLSAKRIPIRFGIVGLGYRSMKGVWLEEILPALEAESDLFEVAALCDIDVGKRDAAMACVRSHCQNTPDLYASYEEMFREAKLDAVYLAVPNYLHAPVAIAALRAGVDVLCEKPVATTLSDADAMAVEAESQDRILGFFMQMHYRRRYHRVAELIREGRIGEPVMVWCTEFRGPFPEWMGWIPEQEKSGGALVEKNCHHCDILDLWADSRPVSVYAQGGQKKFFELCGKKSEIIDHAWVNYDYVNGVKAMIGINFTQNHRHQREFGVAGTEGMVRFDLRDGEKLHLTNNQDDNEVIECPGNLRGGVLVDFLRSVQTRMPPLVNFERGRSSLLVPLAAECSLREGRVVRVDEIDPRFQGNSSENSFDSKYQTAGLA